jgi:hypothetical protein
MTSPTGLGNIYAINRGTRVGHRLYAMKTVATGADGHFLVARLRKLAVNASRVFGFLVDTKGGIVPFHEIRVAMAFAAKSPHVARLRLSDKTLSRVHRQGRVVLGHDNQNKTIRFADGCRLV